MSFFARLLKSSPYYKLEEDEVHSDDHGDFYCDQDVVSVPVDGNSINSTMTSLRQYGSLASRAGGSPGFGISKQQIRLYILIKDLFIKLQINNAVVRRRQFCLFIVFDVFFTTFLWIFCLELKGNETFYSIIDSEVWHYNFKTSLFDVVVVTYLRAFLLLFFINASAKILELLIFVNSFVSISFLFYKIFNFEKLNENSFVVALLVQSFLCSWGELLLFDYSIFHHIRDATRKGFFKPEKKPLLEGMSQTESYNVAIRRYSTMSKSSTASGGSGFFSPFEEDSEMESIVSDNDSLNAEDLAYLKKGQEILLLAMDIIFSDGWTKELKNDFGDLVESKMILKGTKVFRMQAVIHTSPRNLMKVLYDDFEGQPVWNKNVLQSKIIKKIDEHTDIAYTLAASKGPVSSRDFVVLRHRGAVGQSLVIGSISIETDLVPINKSYVRGENGPGCFVITPLANVSHKCEFRWLMNTNLKGWLPQKAVDSAFTSVMLNYVDELRKFISLNPVESMESASFSDISSREGGSDSKVGKTVAIKFDKSPDS